VSAYEVWVVESHPADELEGPWEIEDVEHGPGANMAARDRAAKENGMARDSSRFGPTLKWRSRRYVPEAKP